jgi:hypothetical protein
VPFAGLHRREGWTAELGLRSGLDATEVRTGGSVYVGRVQELHTSFAALIRIRKRDTEQVSPGVTLLKAVP